MKCSLLLIFVLHEHNRLIVSSKSYLYVCSFRWINSSLKKGEFFFFCINHFFKKASLFSIPNCKFRAVPFIYTIREKKFLKVFDLKGMGLIVAVDADLKE